MKQYKMASAVLVTVPVLFIATFSIWAAADGAKATSVSAAEVASADAIDTAEAAQVTTATGLDIVMDGSSLEAYEISLEKVRETGSETDYASLKNAFKYLLLYDLGAKRDPEKLAARLDGKTGHEILARVKWGKPKQKN